MIEKFCNNTADDKGTIKPVILWTVGHRAHSVEINDGQNVM